MSKPDDPYKERDDKIREALHASGLAHIRTLLTHPNAKEASKLVEDHAANDFDKEYAGELEALTLDCAKEDEQTDAVRDALHDLEQQKKATKSHLTVSELKGTGQTTGLPFSAWGLNDQVKFVCTILLMMLVLLAGSGNVFSAIMAKAEPIFLDHPILALFLACLLPAGSLALHSLGDLLSSDRSRHRYLLTILFLTALLLFAWAVLFGLTFQIGNDTIDFDALSQPADQTASVFTIVQLLAEMFCGASLALVANHMHGRYSGDSTIRNPEAVALEERIGDLNPQYETLHAKRRMSRIRLMQIKAMRQVHISEQVALFLAMRRRFDDSNPL